MHKRMITRGLEGTELVITDGKKDKEGKKSTSGVSAASKRASSPVRKLGDKELSTLVKSLAEVERIIAVLSRRGIKFADFVQAYYDPTRGGLPCFRICVEGKDEIYYEMDEYEKRIDELKERTKASGLDEEEESIAAEELHEVARINEINKTLKKQFGLDLKDFLLKAARSVSGEALPTKFQLINGQDSYDVASLGDICAGIRQIGGKGTEIKRFKGLGEMNADQLWDTTMNPATRTLLSVKIEDAGEADRLFSILMGSDVEKRRNFIRDHALEVQNLDV
jgi:DNA gyrase subunit B